MGLTFGEHLDLLLGGAAAPASFGVPGGQTLPFYGAAHGSGRRQVVMRDERNAACAADAYARVTGAVGICDATMGPGVTNLVSGLAEAHASSVPVLAIIADLPTDLEHLRGRSVASQSASQVAMLTPVCKWVGRVHRADALRPVLAHALRIAVTGRPGPVAVEIPEDLFIGDAGPGAEADDAIDARDLAFPRYRPRPHRGDVEAVADAVRSARRPVLLAGGGVTLTGAAPAVAAFATRCGVPVVTTINGKGALDERHALAAGVVGMFGSSRANAVLDAADLVLAIGTKLDQLSTHRWRLPRPDQHLIHVDSDGEELGRALPCRLAILADARAFIEELDTVMEHDTTTTAAWIDDLPTVTSPSTSRDDPRIAPEAVVRAIDDVVRPGDLLVSDASLSSGWAAAHFRVKTAGVGLLAPRGLAGIGWGPGAAVGARVAAGGDRRVVALTGDGAFGYALGELETAVRLQLDLVFVVLNNSALAWIKHVESQMQIEHSSDFRDVDFAMVARGMGASGMVVDSVDDVRDALLAAIEHGGTHVIDVRTSAASSPIVGYGKLRRGAYQ